MSLFYIYVKGAQKIEEDCGGFGNAIIQRNTVFRFRREVSA